MAPPFPKVASPIKQIYTSHLQARYGHHGIDLERHHDVEASHGYKQVALQHNNDCKS